jgi:hypothetical protein
LVYNGPTNWRTNVSTTAKYILIVAGIHVEHAAKKARLGLQLFRVNCKILVCDLKIFLYA